MLAILKKRIKYEVTTKLPKSRFPTNVTRLVGDNPLGGTRNGIRFLSSVNTRRKIFCTRLFSSYGMDQ
jgi:hypothetical protein